LVIARVDGIVWVQTVLPYTAMALARPTLLSGRRLDLLLADERRPPARWSRRRLGAGGLV
jgi:hypothetical protein